MRTALWDDLHVSRGKAEQLEARLRRQAIEDEVRRGRNTTLACSIQLGFLPCEYQPEARTLAWSVQTRISPPLLLMTGVTRGRFDCLKTVTQSKIYSEKAYELVIYHPKKTCTCPAKRITPTGSLYQSHKRLDREREQKWQEDLATAKQDSARHRLDFERQVPTAPHTTSSLVFLFRFDPWGRSSPSIHAVRGVGTHGAVVNFAAPLGVTLDRLPYSTEVRLNSSGI